MKNFLGELLPLKLKPKLFLKYLTINKIGSQYLRVERTIVIYTIMLQKLFPSLLLMALSKALTMKL